MFEPATVGSLQNWLHLVRNLVYLADSEKAFGLTRAVCETGGSVTGRCSTECPTLTRQRGCIDVYPVSKDGLMKQFRTAVDAIMTYIVFSQIYNPCTLYSLLPTFDHYGYTF